MDVTEISREEYEAEKKEKEEKRRADMKRYTEKWRAKNKAHVRNYMSKWLYNLTLEQRDALLAAQGNACAICGVTDPGSTGWHVDHCHKTKVVRGILCHSCNLVLGHAKDDVTVLRKAIDYLVRN